MIKKERILRFLEQYNLGGTIDGAILEIKDNDIFTIFNSPEKDLRGKIVMTGFQMPDNKIGIYTTGELLKLFSILEGDLDFQIIQRNDGVVTTIVLSDNNKKEVKYATCVPELIDTDGRIANISDYETEINLDRLLIQDILKSCAAITSKGITFVNQKGNLSIVFNYGDNNENKIKFDVQASKLDSDLEFMSFSLNHIKQILSTNASKFTDAKMKISSKGVLEISFKDASLDIEANYWIIKLKD